MRAKPYITKADLVAEERPPIHATAVYDSNQAAAMIGLSPITVERAARAGELTRIKIGDCLRFTGQHLLDWLKSKEVTLS